MNLCVLSVLGGARSFLLILSSCHVAHVALYIIICVLVAGRGCIEMVRARMPIDASKRLSTATAGTVVRMLWSRKGELKILFRHESCRRA